MNKLTILVLALLSIQAALAIDISLAAAAVTTCASGCSLSGGLFVGGNLPGANDNLVINLPGTYTINIDADLTIGGITLGGLITIGGTQKIVVNSGKTLSLSSATTIGESAILEVSGTLQSTAQTTIEGALTIKANAEAEFTAALTVAADATFTVEANAQAHIHSTSSFAADSAVNIAGELKAEASTTLDGALTVSGKAYYNATFTASASASIAVQAAGELEFFATTSISTAVSVAANGYLRVRKSVTTITNKALTTSGHVVVYGQLTLTGAAGIVTQSGGELVLQSDVNNSGTLTCDSVVMTAGSLKGIGTINADVAVSASATVSVGNSPGTMTINGDFTLSAGATLNVEVESTTVFDKLIILGKATYNNAKLVVQTTGNFAINTLAQTTAFVIATHTSQEGTFSNVDAKVTVEYTATTTTMHPSTGSSGAQIAYSTLILLILALLSLLI